jgi:hypothetical protein
MEMEPANGCVAEEAALLFRGPGDALLKRRLAVLLQKENPAADAAGFQ